MNDNHLIIFNYIIYLAGLTMLNVKILLGPIRFHHSENGISIDGIQENNGAPKGFEPPLRMDIFVRGPVPNVKLLLDHFITDIILKLSN